MSDNDYEDEEDVSEEEIAEHLDKIERIKVNDPFDAPLPPEEWSYQWVAVSIFGSESLAEWSKMRMERDGWRPVPAERHPDMPSKDDRIEFGGCVLMERPASFTKAAREETEQAARDMLRQARDHVTIPTTETRPGGPEAYKEADAPVTVQVTMPLRLSTNLVTAASVCGITPEEYAQRVIILMMRGDLNYMLLPTVECDAFELFDRLIVTRPDKGNAHG